MDKKGLKIIIAVLVLLLGVSVAYIGYNKFINKEDDVVDGNKENNSNKETCNVTNFYENLANERENQHISGKNIEVIIDKNGDVYYNLYNDDFKIVTDLEKKNYEIEGYYEEVSADGPVDYVFEGYKADISNVVNGWFKEIGNSGAGYMLFLKKDGTVAYLQIDIVYDKVYIETVKEVPNLKNIVSFIECNNGGAGGGGPVFYLVDINGNRHVFPPIKEY